MGIPDVTIHYPDYLDGYRAGVEAMRDEALADLTLYIWDIETIERAAARLLEEKK